MRFTVELGEEFVKEMNDTARIYSRSDIDDHPGITAEDDFKAALLLWLRGCGCCDDYDYERDKDDDTVRVTRVD